MHTLCLKVRICHKAVPKYIITKDSLRQQHELRPRSRWTLSAPGWKQVRQVDYAHRSYTDTVHGVVWVEEDRDREHIFLKCVGFFSHSEWRPRNALICSPFSAGVTCRCTWGVVVLHQGFGIQIVAYCRAWKCMFLGMEGFCNTSEPACSAGRSCLPHRSGMLQLTTRIQKSASLVTARRVQSQTLKRFQPL